MARASTFQIEILSIRNRYSNSSTCELTAVKNQLQRTWHEFNPPEPPSTCSNHSTGLGTRPVVELYKSLGLVQPYWTSSIICHEFRVVQHFRTSSNHSTGGAWYQLGVVQPNRTSLNLLKPYHRTTVVELDMSLGCFNPIKPPRTCLNHRTGLGTRPVIRVLLLNHRVSRFSAMCLCALCCNLVSNGLA